MFFVFASIFFISNSILVSAAASSPAYWANKNISNLAVVVVPVADVIAFPLDQKVAKMDINKAYQDFTYAPKIETEVYSCLRLHQLLFNEIVIVKKELKEEVKIEFPGLFYINANGKRSNEFWTLRKYVKPLANKFFRNINLLAIPPPFFDPENKINKYNVLTLKWPWQDKITKRTYSAGTRFVRNKFKDTVDNFAIVLIETKNFKKVERFVPKELAMIEYPVEHTIADQKESIRLFVNLLKEWAKNCSIPYVWGGASFIAQIKDNIFFEISKKYLSNNIIYYERPGMTKPYTGFECSSLILRAAQVIGLPYFCKNTEAIYRTLRPLNKSEMLEEGDLIWYKGHVQVISNLKENKLIESVGYKYGYGLLHEVELSKVFQGIKNYSQLIKAYNENATIKRINNKGVPARIINKFLLLKLNSIYQ